MEKTQYNKAWFLVLPVLALVAFSAVLPLMTVVNYAFNDTFGQNEFFWAGLDWFEDMVTSDRLHAALGRQMLFSVIVLLIQIPLGIYIALNMPKSGFWASFCLVLMALPLLIPFNVVGTIWQIFGRVDIGLLGHTLAALGIDYNYTNDPIDAWITVIVMDVWHWTSLVALLCYAGLQSIPQAYYQAARIDQATRWSVFRYIELPKMKGVLLIHGQLHDLHRALRPDRGRPGQRDDLPFHRPRQDGDRPVRPWPRRRLLDHVFPGDPLDLVGLLHRDDQH
jgi:glycerol transport system permease protein